MSLDPHYRALLRKSLGPAASTGPERKKRRKHTTPPPPPPAPSEDVNDDSLFGSDSSDSMEFEDVDTEGPSNHAATEPDASSTAEGDGDGIHIDENDGDDSDDFEDLEDVDLEAMLEEPQKEHETLTFTINEKKEEEAKGKRKKVTVVPKAERHRRKIVHQLYIMAMVAHGVIRNKWCNDKTLQRLLVEDFATGLKNHFDPPAKLIDYVKQRHFVEGLQKLVKYYRFRVMAQGLVRKDWGELLVKQELVVRNVDQDKFRQMLCAFRGSRDLGAQGFVCLLRGYGLNARLVFSLQPPDFRSITPAKKEKEDEKEKKPKHEEKPRSEFDPIFIPDSRGALLLGVRRGESKPNPRQRSKKKFNFPISPFPVFWVEVWNPYLKKWITVDPIVNQSVEVMPMRKKGKFEAPALDPTHQTLYVLAFDKAGGIRDVTRRYTQYYNAKTVKKRIDYLSDKDEHWFEQLLKAARSERKYGLPDIKETQEFILRDQYEGVPNNMADFKNHPLYALESQLRKDEVIHPNDDTSKCGTFRPMNKDSVVPIYKRSHVYRLRTAKAWYLRGRVLKVGAQPLRTKEKQLAQMEEEDEDGLVRLYAEFQTQLYHAPRIVDGVIPKNAYGNVEIFVPSMMPENGYLVQVSEIASIKMIEKAAKDILHIDHARAIVAFDFTEKSSKNRRSPTARVGGVLVDMQYKEAIDLVLEGLIELEEEEKRRQVELTALRGWNFFLKKLMVMDRLNKQHGKLQGEEEDSEAEDEGYFSVGSEDESGGDDTYNNHESREERFQRRHEDERALDELDDEQFGGFLPNEENASVPATPPPISGPAEVAPKEEDERSDFEEGGFMVPEESIEPKETTVPKEDPDDGGFLAEEGGFMAPSPSVKAESASPDLHSPEDGGFFAPEPSNGVGEGLDDNAENPSDNSESDDLSDGDGMDFSFKPTQEDKISPQKHEEPESSEAREAQKEVIGDTAAKQGEASLPKKEPVKLDESKRTSQNGPANLVAPEVAAGRTSSTENKTSSFEEPGEYDEELQNEIQREEAELGFEYSDSE